MSDFSQFFQQPLLVDGNALYDSRIQPGPMEGVMNPLYCAAMNKLGWIDSWITPFLRLSVGIPKAKKLEQFLERFVQTSLPVVVQLMGTDAELMGEVAYEIYKLHDGKRINIRGFDINCGCPSRVVLKNGSGGTLLKNPALIASMVKSIKTHLPKVPVEVKIRTGFESADESANIIPALCDSGADLLHVHYRTVVEGYRTIDNGLNRLEQAVQLAGAVPVFGSGDIYTVADADKMVRETGCAGVLAARGLLKDPFLIQKIRHREMATVDKRVTFFRALQKAALGLSKLPRKGGFMEQAAWLFGPQDPFFRKLTKMCVEEIVVLDV